MMEVYILKKTISLLLAVITLFGALACTLGCKDTTATSENTPVEDGAQNSQIADTLPDYTTKKEYGNTSALGAESSKGDKLPTISITVLDGKDIESKYYYQQAKVSVTDCPEQYQLTNVSAEVRKRGNGTYSWEKAPYRIRFYEKYNLLGQGNGYGKSWVLLSNMGDGSMMRTHAAFAMAQRLENIAWCSSSSFVHVYVNGKYRGVYELAEQHNTSDGRIEINEDPNVIDTDYLLELDKYASSDGKYGVDWFTVGSFSYSGGTGTGVRQIDYLIRSDYNTKEKCQFLEQYFKEADAAILNGSYEEVSKYIDLPSFVDMYILHELTRAGDCGWSSFFMVKKAGDKIYFTCPWDFDMAFGRDNRIHNNSFKYLHAGNGIQREKQSHRWYYLMFKQKWFVDMVVERWDEVARDMVDIAVAEIDRIYTDFYGEFMKNYEIWGQGSTTYDEDFIEPLKVKGFDQQVWFLKFYLGLRFDWLDNYFHSDKKYEQIGTPID